MRNFKPKSKKKPHWVKGGPSRKIVRFLKRGEQKEVKARTWEEIKRDLGI